MPALNKIESQIHMALISRGYPEYIVDIFTVVSCDEECIIVSQTHTLEQVYQEELSAIIRHILQVTYGWDSIVIIEIEGK